jgi:hypothetical protein
MGISKSSRHAKIIGDFGERMICNWLSRSGFEVAIVDHTGLDIIAYDPRKKKRLGITVKSRTRDGNPSECVNIFTGSDERKLTDACAAFGCEPWIGIYVETEGAADLYLLPLDRYEARYRNRGAKVAVWKMTDGAKKEYGEDSLVRHVRLEFDVRNWFDD